MNKTDTPKPDLSDGIALDQIPEGHLLAGTFRGKEVVLARSGGHFYGVEATCSHMGAPLADGIAVEGRVHCPWHHARFSLTTGEAVAAPALRALGCYRTALRGDKVYVTEAMPPPSRDGRTADARQVVIVGAGAGGYACAEMLARQGFGGRITLISDDPDAPYDRTLCSKQYLSGENSRADARIAGVPASIERLTGEVTAIDTGRRTLTVSGASLTYNVLVLATGARPIRSKLPGFDRPNVFVVRTLRDADAILEAAKRSERVAILGASFIGLEVAASMRQRGLEVDVIAPGEVPLARTMGPDIGAMIRRVHEEKGVRFHLGRQAISYDGRAVHLDHGGTVEADFVVTGIGVVPRTELAAAAGLACAPEGEGGVVVDARLESSVAGIFAIGDIATYPDVYSEARQRVEHWVHAQRQGQFVARVILGEAERFQDLPFFWSLHYDTGLTYQGHVTRASEMEVEGSIAGRQFTARVTGTGAGKALIACNQDAASLLVEAHWEQALTRVER